LCGWSSMRFSRSTAIIFLACFLSVASWAWAQAPIEPSANPASPAAQNSAILPQAFGGWQMLGAAATSTDAAVADPANAAVLKEYRFTDVASATYTREDGRTLKIRAARFADSSGAFGAYTFYLQPEMKKEDVGDQASSMGERVLFYRGQVLADAVFSQQTAMSVAQLRELAGDLPKPTGSAANLPTFIEFMPRRDYIANTQKYLVGPAALNACNAPVSADVADFKNSSEATLARYDTPTGEATLMLIAYPTPQMAADHMRRIEVAHQQSAPQAGVAAIEDAGTFFYKRTGPIIAIATKPGSEGDAKSLLGRVNYEASVTWNTAAENTEVRDLTKLILNVVVLCAILAALAIVAGVAFGGFRILMKRLYPDKIFDRPEQMEFISLHLTETVVKGMAGGSETGPQAPENPAWGKGKYL